MSSDFEPQIDGTLKDKKSGLKGTLTRLLKGAWSLLLRLPRKLRIVCSIAGVTGLIIFILFALRPEAQKRPIPETIVKVDVVEVVRSSYPIVVNTSGTIQADTRGNLVSQIRGEIVSVSEKFKNGGAFTKGEVLIKVDQRDYLAALSQAAASVSQAEAAYRQEQANARQASSDWQRLGNTGPIPDLVARKPQLAAAKAQMESAQATFESAQLDLERTNITAPYTGRVIQRNAVLGQYVGVGTVLAEIFATDAVEVRLPLSQDEFTQLGLDGLSGTTDSAPFQVELSTEVGNQRYYWDAMVTRTDSTFDINTRQIDVIATVTDPFSSAGDKPALKIGQFVNADIQGRTIENAFVVPNKALREGSYVFISKDQRLVRAPVTIYWQDDRNALIESGLNEGDLVVTTSLNSTLAGARVKLSDPAGVANVNQASTTDNNPAISDPPAPLAPKQPSAAREVQTPEQKPADQTAEAPDSPSIEQVENPLPAQDKGTINGPSAAIQD